MERGVTVHSDQQCQLAVDRTPLVLYEHDIDVVAAESQCDCACALHPSGVRTGNQVRPSATTPVRLTQPFIALSLTPNHYATLAWQTSGVVVLDAAALNIARYFEQPHTFADLPAVWFDQWGRQAVENTLDQLICLRILTAPGMPAYHADDNASVLTAWLHVTDRCNLRCAYCYLPHQRLDMSTPTGRSVLDAVFRSAVSYGHQQVKLKYAGGEPLLRPSFIAALQRYARSLADHRRLELDAVVLSNGTLLTKSIIARLKSLDIRLMISLDGLGTFHNAQRCFAGGRNSFDEVQRAIELAVACEWMPDISITVSGRNASGLPQLVQWLLEHNLRFGLNFYRANDFSTASQDLELSEYPIIDALLQTIEVIKHRTPARSMLTSLVDRANLAIPHAHTCQAGRNYLVFDPQGHVAKCQMLIGRTLCTADAPDPLGVMRRDTIELQNISVDEKQECRNCDWRYWCAGGCPIDTWRSTGRYDKKSPNCTLYQELFPEVVRLEGMRLLNASTLAVSPFLEAPPSNLSLGAFPGP